jgi:hypothetical protein
VLVYAIPVVLAVWALVDLVQTPSSRARWMPRFVWAIAIIGIPVIGPLVWLLFGARRRRRGVPGGTPQPPRTLGPDDDPEFLRGIDEQRRRERRSQEGRDGRVEDGPQDQPEGREQPDSP